MIIGCDILNDCLTTADASSRADAYKKMFENVSVMASSFSEDKSEDSSYLLPLALKVAAKTIGFDLVSDLGGNQFSEITEDGELIEAECDCGMAPPSGKLYYMDYIQK